MGNHEYCSDCGESNFHLNRPCDPEKKAKMQFENRAIEYREKQANTRAEQVVLRLKQMGYPQAKIGAYGHVVIEKWSLI